MMPFVRSLRWTALLVAITLFAASCGGPSGPDLVATVNATESVQGTATAADLGIDTKGADQSWRATGTPASVADAIAAKEVPDERTDDADGDVFLLYKSGTLWVRHWPTRARASAIGGQRHGLQPATAAC